MYRLGIGQRLALHMPVRPEAFLLTLSVRLQAQPIAAADKAMLRGWKGDHLRGDATVYLLHVLADAFQKEKHNARRRGVNNPR